jgi:hypothetical protein
VELADFVALGIWLEKKKKRRKKRIGRRAKDASRTLRDEISSPFEGMLSEISGRAWHHAGHNGNNCLYL